MKFQKMKQSYESVKKRLLDLRNMFEEEEKPKIDENDPLQLIQ